MWSDAIWREKSQVCKEFFSKIYQDSNPGPFDNFDNWPNQVHLKIQIWPKLPKFEWNRSGIESKKERKMWNKRKKNQYCRDRESNTGTVDNWTNVCFDKSGPLEDTYSLDTDLTKSAHSQTRYTNLVLASLKPRLFHSKIICSPVVHDVLLTTRVRL